MSNWTITNAGVLGTDTLAEFFAIADGQSGTPVAVGKSESAGFLETAVHQAFTINTDGSLALSGSLTSIAHPSGTTAAAFVGMSRDQSVWVGYANATADNNNAKPYYYKSGAWNALATLAGVADPSNGGVAWAVTPTGDRIVGTTISPELKNHAVYWDEADSYAVTDLGLPDATYKGSIATAVSADGSVIVGQLDSSANKGRFFRWTQATGMVDIGIPAGVLNGNEPFIFVSGDGNTLTARNVLTASGASHAFVWTSAGGWVDLGILSDGFNAQPNFINADGTIIVGMADDADGVFHAVRWTGSGKTWTIEQLPNLFFGGASEAWWANEAGTHIAGVATTSGGVNDAVVWSLVTGGGVPVTPNVFDPPAFDNLALVTAKAAQPNWVERLTKMFDSGDSLQNAWFLDGAVAPTAIKDQASGVKLYGLWHLRNQTVTAWLSGVDCGDFTIAADGTLSVPYSGDFTRAQFWHYPTGVVGYTYTSQGQLLRPMLAPDAGAANGPALGKTRRLHMWTALFVNTIGVSVGTLFSSLRNVVFRTKGGIAYPATEMFNGVHQNTAEDDYDFDGMLCWQVTRPYPVTISTIGGFIHTQDR